MKIRNHILHFLLTAMLLLALPVIAYGAGTEDEDRDKTLAPYLWIKDEDVSVDSFPLKETHVSTNINGVIAETYVTQVYTNQGTRPINASYLFPASASVTVHGMTMQIGNQLVTAKIKEKEEAKEEFEEAKKEGKSASLLEQQRPNVFSMDVANIMPGDEVRIRLHYTDQIMPREGVYQFVFPTVVGPRFATPEEDGTPNEKDQWVESPYYKEGTAQDGKYDIEVNLSTGVPIRSLTCKSHDIASEGGEGQSTATVKLAHPETFAGDRDFILEYQLAGEELSYGLMLSAGEKYQAGGSTDGAGATGEDGNADGAGVTGEDGNADGAGATGEDGNADGAGATGEDGNADGAGAAGEDGNAAGARESEADGNITGATGAGGNAARAVGPGISGEAGSDENFFMLMVQPPERVQPEEILPREYIFVLDVSGSMIGYPLDTAKDMIRNLVSGLKETDKFNVILFSMDTLKLSRKSLPATQKNIQNALEFIDKEEGGGGTMLAPAVEEAIAVPAVSGVARNIVIVTDGYISGEREIFNIINQNIDNTSFFAFGIGSSVNRYLIDGIAKTGMGESFVVTDSEDAEEAADYFLTYIEAPLLTDIHVEYDGFEAYDTEPEKVPVLFAQRPIVLFGKWRGDPSGTIRIKGKAGGQDYEQEIPVTAEAISEDAGAVRYLWARTRVEKLTDYGYMPTGDQEDPEVRKEITDIGLKYSMMTPYTSFIAVLDIIRNEDGDAADVDQPLPLPSGVTENALGGVSVSSGGYTTGSEPGEIALWVMLAVVMCLPVVRRMRRRRKVRV